MCVLGEIKKVYQGKSFTGWKVFLKQGRFFHSIYMHKQILIPKGRWTLAVDEDRLPLHYVPLTDTGLGLCGFWMFRTRKQAREYRNYIIGFREKERKGKTSVRKVEMRGAVVEHEDGYRGQWMKIVNE